MTNFLIVLLMLALGGVAAGGWSMFGLARTVQKRVGDRQRRKELEALPEWARTVEGDADPVESWNEGSDLLRYPARLGELSRRLEQSHAAVREQLDRLASHRAGIAGKDDRAELVARYDEDTAILGKRAESMCRVLTLVWRTRATLRMRAHVAITARQRPELQGLPEGEVAVRDLALAAEAYERAAGEVRAFVELVDRRSGQLDAAVPRLPELALTLPEDREQVDQELARARDTYTELRDRMDRLADTLGYLADRCRTRHVVVDAPAGMDAELGGEQVFEEVNGALLELQDLAELGDRHLADAAMDNLAEDISQLERAGLEAQAEADANLEIARLLEQFQQG